MASNPNIPTLSEPALTGLMREEHRFCPRSPQTFGDRLNQWFDLLVSHSGLEVTPALVLSSLVSVGMIMAGTMFVWQENLLSAAVGLLFGVGGSLLFLRILRNWRFRQIQQQLPEGVDIMIRSVRAGRSLEQSIEELSRELGPPLGTEFKRVSTRLGLGLSVASALRELPQRVPLPGVHIFATALTIHQQTGGNLIQALEQLAQTIRDRAEFRGKFMAATAGSRFATVFLLAIGPIVLAYQSLRDPGYLSALTQEPAGRSILIAAFILQVVGSLWILSVFRTGVGETDL